MGYASYGYSEDFAFQLVHRMVGIYLCTGSTDFYICGHMQEFLCTVCCTWTVCVLCHKDDKGGGMCDRTEVECYTVSGSLLQDIWRSLQLLLQPLFGLGEAGSTRGGLYPHTPFVPCGLE